MPLSTPSPIPNHSRTRFWTLVAILGSLVVHASLLYWFQRTRYGGGGVVLVKELKLHHVKLDRVEINPKWIDPKIRATPPEKVDRIDQKVELKPIVEERNIRELAQHVPTVPTREPVRQPESELPQPTRLEVQSPTLIKPSINQPTELEANFQNLAVKPIDEIPKPRGRPILETNAKPQPATTQQLPSPEGRPTPKASPSRTAPRSGEYFTGSMQMDELFGMEGIPGDIHSTPTTAGVEPPKTPQIATPTLDDRPKTKQNFESLNPFLTTELFTFETLRNQKPEGFFMVRISAKPNQKLPIIPKDVYFILDVSSSIGKSRLHAFRQTVLNSISDLHPGDRFRIFAFRGKLIPFSEDWNYPHQLLSHPLGQWFEQLGTGGVTDFYDGLSPLSQHPAETGRTTLAFVFSDGVPTKGVLDSTQIISSFSSVNEGKVSIFTLSSGGDVNNFLLDFLAYRNQGRLKYISEIAQSNRIFETLIEQVNNPLFLNLRFRFAGVEDRSVYPQVMPHLYEHSPVLLFGRYQPGQTEKISLQVLGESGGRTKELLVELPIPTKPNGSETLASTWARQRIYHLLGQMTLRHGVRDSLLQEVRKLSDSYNVEVPYF
jgi:hypothetical protein